MRQVWLDFDALERRARADRSAAGGASCSPILHRLLARNLARGRIEAIYLELSSPSSRAHSRRARRQASRFFLASAARRGRTAASGAVGEDDLYRD
jgi:hypothetical protein